jgi:hypothetical protein
VCRTWKTLIRPTGVPMKNPADLDLRVWKGFDVEAFCKRCENWLGMMRRRRENRQASTMPLGSLLRMEIGLSSIMFLTKPAHKEMINCLI